MSPTLALTEDLLRRPSVSPEDHGCMDVICARLEPLGFSNERLRFGPVENLWSRRGNGSPVLCFAGHTDVVPTGPREDWRTDPFEPVDRRRRAVCARRRRHEEQPRRHGDGHRAVRRPASRPRGLARVPVHQRRGRPVGRRHAQGDGGARSAPREDRLVRRRRTDQRRRARRHHQGGTSRLALRPPDGARRAGSHRLPAPRRQPGARFRACARGTGRNALGRRQ